MFEETGEGGISATGFVTSLEFATGLKRSETQ